MTRKVLCMDAMGFDSIGVDILPEQVEKAKKLKIINKGDFL